MPKLPGYFFIRVLASEMSWAQVVGGELMPAAWNWFFRYQMPRTPPNHGTPQMFEPLVSLASMPDTRSDLLDQEFTWGAMLASMPSAASAGVSVLPSSVMSGAFLPVASAFCQSVVRSAHGIHTTLILVFLYCEYCLWNCAKTPFIHLTSLAADGPIRQTVSDLGIAALPDGEPLPELLHPAAAPASARAALIARAEVLSRTGGSPFPGSPCGAYVPWRRTGCLPRGGLCSADRHRSAGHAARLPRPA